MQATGSKTATAAQNEITSVLVAQHPGSSSTDFSVLNQASLLQTVQSNNRTFTVLLGAVAAISLLVGGIGVMNIMLVTVTERTREIGIRKAIGARYGHILTQFLVEAVLLAGIGGILGARRSASRSSEFVTIENVMPVVEPYSVALALAFAIGVGLFFGIYPANRAAQLRPDRRTPLRVDQAGHRDTPRTTTAPTRSLRLDVDEITPDDTLLADVQRTRLTTPLTRVLLALVVVAGAFLAGAVVERTQHKSSSASSSLAALAAQFRNRLGGRRPAAPAAPAAGWHRQRQRPSAPSNSSTATTSTCRTSPATSSRSRRMARRRSTSPPRATVKQLKPGTSVIVQGTASSDGTSTATSISQSSGFGGGGGGPFGGGGGGGTGAAGNTGG